MHSVVSGSLNLLIKMSSGCIVNNYSVTRLVKRIPWYGVFLSFPVAARSKAWVCGCSLAGIAGSNPAGTVHVCLLQVLCFVR